MCLLLFRYDGQRAQIHKFDDGSVRIFSRNGDEMTTKFPDLVHIIQESCKTSAESFIIDAEVFPGLSSVVVFSFFLCFGKD